MNYFLFDKTQKYINRIPEEVVLEANYTEEINTAGQLELTLPAQYRLAENIFYICINDPNDSASYLMFKILKETVTDVNVSYTCIENAYDELASYTYIQDKRPTMAANQMTSLVLQGTRWSVGSCPTTNDQFCSFYYISPLEALQKIVNLWGLEITFQVKIDGNTNEIKQRNVNLYTQQGSRTNKRFEYGSNLLSVKQVGDVTDLYTALIGRGKGEEVNNGDGDTDPDGYGRRITFADVEWSKSKGNPLDKAKGIEYLEDPQATAAYGFPDGHARIGMVIFQDCEDPNELIQLTYQKLLEVNHPQVQFSADIVDVGQLNLGDTVAIIRHDIGIEYSTRVFKVEHNLLDENKNSIELGDNISQSNSITQQISSIKSEASNVQNVIDTIVMPGASGNKLFFGTEFPVNGTDGDVFYKDLGNGNTEMYIYSNGGWQLVVSTEQLDSIDKQVTEQQQGLQQAIQTANDAVSKADAAISQGDALKTTVATKADASQVAQLSNVIQSTVATIGAFYPNGSFNDSVLANYYDNVGTNDLDRCWWSNSDSAFDTTVCDMHIRADSTSPQGMTSIITKEYLPVYPTAPLIINYWTASIYTDISVVKSIVRVHEYDANKNEIKNYGYYVPYDKSGVWYKKSQSITLLENTKYVRLEWYVSSTGAAMETLLTNINVQNGISSVASKITQMSDDINLRVQKGDLISQINIEAGKTLIQSDKLYLDASTVVFSGNAFIPSAAITDISADKITTGTLNAANVNIINMNVANLVGNLSNFVQSAWNGINRSTKIDSSRLTFYNDNNETLVISNCNLDFYNSQSQWMMGFQRIYSSGSLLGGTVAFNISDSYEFFIGKPLKIKGNKVTFQGNLGVDGFDIRFGIVTGSNNFKALTLTTTGGGGFYWGSDGTFGFVTGGNSLFNMKGTSIPTYIDSGGGVSTWFNIR